MEPLQQVYNLLSEKHTQKQLLDSKITKIKELLEETKSGGNSGQTMELLDLVAALKPINRRAYQIQESLSTLVEKCLHSHPSTQSFNEFDFSQSFLPQRLPFYSMQELAM